METIEVCSYIHAPAEDVFAMLTDHEGYTRFDGIRSAHLRKVGTETRNGLGAERVLDLGVMTLVERIERFEEPTCFEYRIIESSSPVEHHGGRVELIRRGEGTEVRWVSRFSVTLPVVGRALERISRLAFTEAFTAMLLRIKSELEA